VTKTDRVSRHKHQRVSKFYKKTKFLSSAEIEEFLASGDRGINLQPTSVLDYAGIINCAESLFGAGDDMVKQARLAVRPLHDETYYTEACKDDCEPASSTKVPEKVLQAILGSGMFEDVPVDNIKRFMSLRYIPELAKERLRAIMWHRQLNDEAPKPLTVSPIGDATKSAEQVLPKTHKFQIDLVRGFYQLPLSEKIRKYYGVYVNGRHMVFSRGPMGANWTADCLHIILSLLLRIAKHRAGTTDTIQSFVHIDNARLATIPGVGPEALQRTALTLEDVLRDFNVDYRVENTNVFLGIEGDHARGIVRLSNDFIRKLIEGSKVLSDEDCKWHEVRALFARCNYAMRVLRIPQVGAFMVWKFMRRRCSQDLEPDAPARLWKSSRHDWKGLIDEILSTNKDGVSYDSRPMGPEQFMLYMDASVTGWGAVLYDVTRGTVKEYGATWKRRIQPRDIPVNETKAIKLAIEHFSDDLLAAGAGELLLLTDSTSAEGAIKKSGSPSFEMNIAVKQALGAFARLDKWVIKIAHVLTADQVADAASRGLRLGVTELTSALGPQVGKRLACAAAIVAVPRRASCTPLRELT